MGMAMRKDWLDELGLDVPVTYDDWHNVLTAFKEQKGATAPLWINASAGDPFNIRHFASVIPRDVRRDLRTRQIIAKPQ